MQLIRLLYFMRQPKKSVGAGGTPTPGGALLLQSAGVNYLLLEGGTDKLLLQ